MSSIFVSKTWFTLWKGFQMWSTRVDSESPHPCGHFDIQIEVVTMKNITARFFSKSWTRSVIQSTESRIGAFDSTWNSVDSNNQDIKDDSVKSSFYTWKHNFIAWTTMTYVWRLSKALTLQICLCQLRLSASNIIYFFYFIFFNSNYRNKHAHPTRYDTHITNWFQS